MTNIPAAKQQELDRSLYSATVTGNTTKVKKALRAGADPNTTLEPLLSAVLGGDTGTAVVLLQAGADVHAGNDRALFWAALRGYAQLVQVLLDAGANCRASNDLALFWARQRLTASKTEDKIKRYTETIAVLEEAMQSQPDTPTTAQTPSQRHAAPR